MNTKNKVSNKEKSQALEDKNESKEILFGASFFKEVGKKQKKISTEKEKLKAPLNVESAERKPDKQLERRPKKKSDLHKAEDFKMVQSRKLQLLSQSGVNIKMPSSPLQIQLMQSESLKISQEKINDLEEELLFLREKNEDLLNAGELLKDKNQELKVKIEEMEVKIKNDKADLIKEKEVLLSALASSKEQMEKIKKRNKDLEKKISSYSYSLSHRESSLEGRIEILKMENTVLQREKDKKIIELKKTIEKNKFNLEITQRKNQELKILNEELQKSSQRAVSALRATIFNLEGVQNEESLTQSQIKKTG
ncbi:MAG: hypothetical protein GDA46_01525 [Bdellovibrionales bacterium]|nr:hypothetical protein [Bdellovibrionales bacterium]